MHPPFKVETDSFHTLWYSLKAEPFSKKAS